MFYPISAQPFVAQKSAFIETFIIFYFKKLLLKKFFDLVWSALVILYPAWFSELVTRSLNQTKSNQKLF